MGFHKRPTIRIIFYLLAAGIIMAGWQGSVLAAPDAYEPDGSIGQETIIPTNHTYQLHNFHNSNDEDWVQFDATEGTRYVIETADLQGSCDTQMILFDSEYQPLYVDDDSGTGLGSKICWLCRSSETYYVALGEKEGRSGNDVTYNLTVYTQSSQSGSISGVPDYNQIDTDCAAVSAADVMGYWDNHSYDGSSPYWNLIDHGDSTAGAIGPTSYHSESDGIVADLRQAMGWTPGSEGVTATEQRDGIVLFCNHSSYGNNLGFEVNTLIEDEGDLFSPSFVALKNEIDAGRPTLFLVYNYPNWFDGSEVSHGLAAVGYLETASADYVKAHDNWSVTGTEVLVDWDITVCGEDGGFLLQQVIPGGVPIDHYEDDNTFSSATEITPNDWLQTHNFFQSGDVDWLEFSAEIGYKYTITTSNLGDSCSTELYLYGSDGATLLRSDTDGDEALIEWLFIENGTYFIKIEESQDRSGPLTNYDLTVTSESDHTPPIPTLQDPGEEVPSPDSYTINWNSVPYASRYRLQESTSSSFSTYTDYEVDTNSSPIQHAVSSDTIYYYRVRGENVSEGFNGDWSNVVDVSIISNSAPVLSGGSLAPASGVTTALFKYEITYTDADNDEPADGTPTVSIDGGSAQTMNKQNFGDTTYTDGCIYEYTLPAGTLAKSVTHTYQFAASDDTDAATGQVGLYTGPTVVNSPPSIDSVSVSPATPFEGATLTAEPVGWLDADSDAELYFYQWYKNDSAAGMPTTQTCNSSNFQAGDQLYCEITPSDSTDSGTAVNSSTVTIQNSADVYGDVVINEFLPNIGLQLTEWVELYNKGALPVDINGCWIDDVRGAGRNAVVISADEPIAPTDDDDENNDEYFVINLPGTFLNNSGDTVNFLCPDKMTVIEARSYSVTQADESIYRFPDGEDWSDENDDVEDFDDSPTPGAPNDGLNTPPVLLGPSVTPSSGDNMTDFTFSVDYVDQQLNLPTTKKVVIDGFEYQMSFSSGEAYNGTYTFTTQLWELANHRYYFVFSDGEYEVRLPIAGDYQGPDVTLPNDSVMLYSPKVTPRISGVDETYEFSVYYYDAAGNAPSAKDVFVDGVAYPLSLISGSADKGTYSYSRTFAEGSIHNYYFMFTSNGGENVRYPSVGVCNEPIVRSANLVVDDFEDDQQFSNSMGFYTDDDATCEEEDIDGTHRLTWDSENDYWYSCFANGKPNFLNARKYNVFSLRIKSEQVNPDIVLKLEDNDEVPARRMSVNLTDYSTVDGTWRTIDIPLSDFTYKDYSINDLYSVALIFMNASGTIYIDDIMFKYDPSLEPVDSAHLPTVKPPSEGMVQIIGNKLCINGQPFFAKSVGYQPTPVGQHGGSWDKTQSAIFQRDFPLIKAMGVNTIKTWSEVSSEMMYEATQHGLMVVAGFYIDGSEDFTDSGVKDRIKTAFREYVNDFKDSPNLLIWSVGNEQNRVYAGDDLSDWYSFANELAQIAYEEEGGSYHPVLIDNAGIGYVGYAQKAADDDSLTYVDVWGLSFYRPRGENINFAFADVFEKTHKPVFITEYDDDTGTEDQSAQAAWDGDLWNDLSVAENCIGCSVFEYSDEWWKFSSGSVSEHDAGGWAVSVDGVAPDNYSNEEFYGLVFIEDNGDSVDNVHTRLAYNTLQERYYRTGRLFLEITRPATPTNISASILSGNDVTLTWDVVSGDIAGYNIYRSQESGGGFIRLNSSSIASTSYIDTGVQEGNTYYYLVTAVNSDHIPVEGAASEEIEIDANPNEAPTIIGLPDRDLDEDTTANDITDLWTYAQDDNDTDAQMVFSITANTEPDCGVTIDSNRYIDIAPTGNWFGTSEVTIRVTDRGGLYDEDIFTITVDSVNDAPTISSVSITPDPAYTNSTLTTVVSGWNDAEGASEDYIYQWWEYDGDEWEEIDDQTSNTLTGSFFQKDDQIKIICTPTDGEDEGTSQEDIITISNAVPTPPTVDITPSSPTTDDNLICAITGHSTDSDSDPISYSYAWYKDGELQAGLTTNTVLATFTSRNEIWRCEVRGDDGTAYSTAGTVQVQIDNFIPTASNLSITPSNPKTTDTIRADYTYSDPDSDPESGSRIRWYRDEEVQAGCNDQTTVPSTATQKGESWYFTVEPSDGASFGTMVTSSTVTILNSTPNITSVSIIPVLAFTETDLIAIPAGWYDADGDDEAYLYQWQENQGGSWYDIESATSSTLDHANFQKDNQIKIICTPTDGEDEGTPKESTITISNSPPSVTSVSITPDPSYIDDILTATPAGWNDVDGDDEGYLYQWHNQDGAMAGETNSTLTNANFDTADLIHCIVTPTDGIDTGEPESSDEVLIYDVYISQGAQLHDTAEWELALAWSLDSTEIAFIQQFAEGSEAFNVFIKTADGSGQPVQVTTDSDNVVWSSQLSWAYDASKVAFVSRPADKEKIMLANVDGSGVETLLSDDAIDYNNPFFAWMQPDEQRRLFYAKDYDIYCVAVDTNGSIVGEELRISDLRGTHDRCVGISVSPDGAKLAFINDRSGQPGGHRGVYAIDNLESIIDGSRGTVEQWSDSDLIKLADFSNGKLETSWSRSGSMVYFSVDSNDVYDPSGYPNLNTVYTGCDFDVYKVSSEGGTASKVDDQDYSQCHMQYSPDGNRISYWSDLDGDGDIYIVTLAAGSPSIVLKDVVTGSVEYTNSQTVNVELSVFNGSYYMKSEDSNFTDAEWVASTFPTTVTHTFLTDTDETKTVYAKFKNDLDVESAVVSDTIELITEMPILVSISLSDQNTDSTTKTNDPVVDVAVNVSGSVADMILSENPDFAGSDWQFFLETTTFTLSSGDREKTVYCKVRNIVQNESNTASDAIALDRLGPSAVSNLIANCPVDSRVVSLAWENPSESDFEMTMIRRKTDSYPSDRNDGTQVYYGSGTSVTDTVPEEKTQYYYRAWSHDDIQNWSDDYAQKEVTSGDTQDPDQIVNFTATASDTELSITLSWERPVSDDYAGVVIRRSTDSAPTNITDGELVVDSSLTSYEDESLKEYTHYYYSAFSYDDIGRYSPSVSANTRTGDFSLPFVEDLKPQNGTAQIPCDTNILLHIKDTLSGVDRDSIVLEVNGEDINLINPEVVLEEQREDFQPYAFIAGTPQDYLIAYDSQEDFNSEQEVNVSIQANDLYSITNRLSYEYSFITQMMDIGGNVRVNDPAIATPDLTTQPQSSIAIGGGNAKNIYVAWEVKGGTGNDWDIYFAKSIDSGSSFSESKKVYEDLGGFNQRRPQIAIDSRGNIFIAYQGQDEGGNTNIYLTASSDGGETFDSPRLINENLLLAESPSIAISNNNRIHLAWTEHTEAGNWVVYYTLLRNFSANAGEIIRVDDGTFTSFRGTPLLKLTQSGDPHVVFCGNKGAGFHIYLSKQEGSDFTSPVQIDASTAVADSPTFDISANGRNIYVAWVDTRSSKKDICFAKSTDSGANFTETTQITDDSLQLDKISPRLCIDSQQKVYLAWSDMRNDDGDIYFAQSLDGGTSFGTNILINDDAGSAWQGNPVLAIDNSAKHVYFIWSDARNEKIEVCFSKNSTAEVHSSNLIEPEEGGSVTVEEGSDIEGTTVTIPQGALEVDTNISIGQVDSPPEFTTLANIAFVGKAISLGPGGTTFGAPITIRIPYTQADLDTVGVPAANLAIYYYNETTTIWERLPSVVYPTYVEAQIEHFSLFILGGEAVLGGLLYNMGLGSCFIATAAYGTPLADEVGILCEFRDRHLLKNELGRRFVRFYYKTSPPIAKTISKSWLLKKIVRFLLRPIVEVVSRCITM